MVNSRVCRRSVAEIIQTRVQTEEKMYDLYGVLYKRHSSLEITDRRGRNRSRVNKKRN